MPPEGKLEPSDSPFTSSLPENSMMMVPFPWVVMKLSCFSAVMPVMGWNQWVKWVAPFSTAQSFMALATMLATPWSRGVPSSMVFFNALKVSFGNRSRMAVSLKTMVPKISDNLLIKSLYTLLVKNSIVAVRIGGAGRGRWSVHVRECILSSLKFEFFKSTAI